MWRFGYGELLLILAIVLIIFGPSKLPEIGKSIGKGLREFQKAIKGVQKDLEESDKETKKESEED